MCSSVLICVTCCGLISGESWMTSWWHLIPISRWVVLRRCCSPVLWETVPPTLCTHVQRNGGSLCRLGRVSVVVCLCIRWPVWKCQWWFVWPGVTRLVLVWKALCLISGTKCGLVSHVESSRSVGKLGLCGSVRTHSCGLGWHTCLLCRSSGSVTWSRWCWLCWCLGTLNMLRWLAPVMAVWASSVMCISLITRLW